jgi:hypothetical protein
VGIRVIRGLSPLEIQSASIGAICGPFHPIDPSDPWSKQARETMPTYEYEIVNERTGEVLATHIARLPVEQRDRVIIRRVKVPRSVSIAGAAAAPSQGGEVLAGYHKQEQKLGSRFRSEFTPAQIKQAWGNF